MYGRLSQHAQSFDYTRRYQNDIVVYSENELRSVMGSLKRGTRIVIANEIYVTKPINVKINYKTQSPDFSLKDIVISGFGGGSLIPKQGVAAGTFDLFRLSPIPFGKSDVAISFNGLFIKGFKRVLSRLDGWGGPTYGVNIVDCKFSDCTTIIDGPYWFLEICNNYIEATDVFSTFSVNRMTMNANQVYATTLDMTCDRSSISGNVFEVSSSTILRLEDSSFSGNFVSCDNVELRPKNPVGGQQAASSVSGNKFNQSFFGGVFNIADGSNWVIDGNHIGGEMQVGALASRSVVSGNYIARSTSPLSGAEGFVFRDNYSRVTNEALNARGRISKAGEIIGQTIVDGVTNTFACTTSSTTYKQLNDDTDASKKAFVSFYVPANRKISVRLQCPVEDLDTHRDFFFIRLTDVDDETSPASFAAFFNDEHQFQLRDDSRIPFVFEWYIDGTDPGINWTAGDLKTFWFQVKVSDSSDTVSFEGGDGIGPIMVSANGISDDLNFVDMG